MNPETEKRIKELAERSFEKGIFTFDDFHGEETLAGVAAMKLPVPVLFFGGAPFAERKMIRFGDADVIGYDEPFPVSVVKITLKGGKFSKAMTHRDYLGSVLGLGVDRGKVGDIFVGDGCAFVCLNSKLVPFITQNLDKIGREAATAEEAEEVDESLRPKEEERSITASGLRLDSLVSKVYNLSREDGAALIEGGKVFAGGRPATSPSYRPKVGEIVSVRGHGKFRFEGEDGTTRRGKTIFKVSVFV